MSRHRDVRSMKYSDEYDGYDDVYGHSVDDDYNVSPEAEEFLFDRNKQRNISSFFVEPSIAKSDDSSETKERAVAENKAERAALTEKENIKLRACIETVRNVVGETVPEDILMEKIILYNFEAEAVLNAILNEASPKCSIETTPAKERSDTQAGFSENTPPSCSTRKFGSPKFAFGTRKGQANANPSPSLTNPKTHGSLTDLMTNHAKTMSSKRDEGKKAAFGNLADLTAHHLQKSNSEDVRTSLFGKGSLSPKTNFVIPKFSRGRGNEETRATAPPSFSLVDPRVAREQTARPSDDAPTVKQDKENLSAKLEELNINEGVMANNWTIDLTTALRSSQSKLEEKSVTREAKISEKGSTNEIPLICTSPIIDHEELNIHVNTEYAVPNEGCELNLSYLRKIKLRYSHKMASSFGQILCKRWKYCKPYVVREKSIINEKIKRFDFSTPSPDYLILTHLRRR